MANPTQLKPTAQHKKPDVIETKKKDIKQSKSESGNDFSKEMNSTESRLKTDVANALSAVTYIHKLNIEAMMAKTPVKFIALNTKIRSAYEKFYEIFNRVSSSKGKGSVESEKRMAEDLRFMKSSKDIVDKMIELNKRIANVDNRRAEIANKAYEDYLEHAKYTNSIMSVEQFTVSFLHLLDVLLLNKISKTELSSESMVNQVLLKTEQNKESVEFFKRIAEKPNENMFREFVETVIEKKNISAEMTNISKQWESSVSEYSKYNTTALEQFLRQSDETNKSSTNSTAPTFKPDWANK